MSPHEREYFDRLLDQVVKTLPKVVLDLMDEVPLIVEDYPSSAVLRETGIQRREQLCGLFRGVPITEPERERGRDHSDLIWLFREGIFHAAMDSRGRITDEALLRQIRITILHEYGHHFGLDEKALDELGYG